MSQIDVYRHELCGELLGLPVYRVLEQVPDGQYACSVGPDKILVGGGSGEHPAAVIDPLVAVGSYIMSFVDYGMDPDTPWRPDDFLFRARHELVESGALSQDEADRLDDAGLEELVAELATALHEGYPDPGEFRDWSGTEWIALADRLEAFAARRPVGKHGPNRPEQWIRESIGEYVLVSYPELVSEQVKATGMLEVFIALRAMAASTPMLLGVMTYPSGYRLGGRLDQMADGNHRH